MKKIALFLLAAFTFIAVMAENKKPTFILEVNACNRIDPATVNQLQNDSTLCCEFEIIQKNTMEQVSRVYHKESGILLGTFTGIPTAEMLKQVYQTQLTPEYIAEIVPRIIEWNSRERLQR